ncbi:MAG: cellulose binding domain-containing protein [Clostridiales bacterium]|nr:cellulose binding domain-containing protein [Clostridiales bacterium]
MKSYRMKFMAILLALLMCVCLVDTHALVADEANGPVYESGDLTYTFTLQGSWNSGYNASIRIDNHSAQAIEDWRFEMEYAGSISNIWNAVIESNADGKYIIKNAGWNQDIAAGSYVEFGLSGAEAFDKYPSSYKMLTGIAENSSEDFDAVFEITNDWTQGFTGRITITNNTDAVIEDWVLEFDGENEISTLWDGQIVSHEGTHYIVKSADYNQNIPVGGSVSFNFNVDFRSSDAEFTNFALSSYADLSQITPPPSGGDDIHEPGEFDDVGEIYIKEPSEDDFVFDEETGLTYVRNQLLVSAFMGLEKSVMEDICEEIGATIVGYIELTNDFQIEFIDDMTLEDLSIMADYLNSYSFVINVTLNLSCPMGEDAVTNDYRYNDGTSWEGSYVADSWNESAPAGDTWGLAKLKVFSAWDYESTFASVRVGIYDTGFAPYHEDLIYAGLSNNSNDWDHGTHVAGTIAAIHNNNKGIAGVASNDATTNKVKLYACGVGTVDRGIMGAKEGFTKLIGNHVKVINLSSHLGTSYTLCISASHPEIGEGSQNARNQLNALASDMESFLTKFISAGYDFVFCCSAGNCNDKTRIIDNSDNGEYGLREVTDSDDLSVIPESDIIVGADAQYNSVLTAITGDIVKERIIVVGNMEKGNSLASDSCVGSRVDVVAPGTYILSTVPTSFNSTGYAYKSGTSMATPHITGIVALMYQANPELRAHKVKEYLIASSTNPVITGGYSYPVPRANKCVESAQSFSTFLTNDVSWPSGTLTLSTLSGVSFSAFRTSSGDYNVGTYSAGKYSFSFESDDEGNVYTVLPQGVYDITVYKEGYLPFSIKNVTINPDETTALGSVSLSAWNSNPRAKYTVQGTVKNAISGNLESGVTVRFRKGWNNQDSAYVKTVTGTVQSTTTDSYGKFTYSLSAGAYTVEISKNGFVTGYYNVISTDKLKVDSNDRDYEYTMVISPVLDDDEYRIVLTWGSTPSDLDSHLTFYVNDVLTSHVYFSNHSASYQGETVAVLDLDDTSSYGPETITITFNPSLVEGGNHFRYCVHDYSNKESTNSTALSMSDAVVHFYKGNTLWNTYFVPKNNVGTVWQVFDIDENGIHTVNGFDNESNASNVG